MSELPASYDAWRTSPPPEGPTCYKCSAPLPDGADDDEGWTCRECGYTLRPAEEADYDPLDAYDLDDPKRWM